MLSEVRRTINKVARELGWPLNRIEFRAYQDPELIDPEYVVVSLVLDCSLDEADGYLEILYCHIDGLHDSLNESSQILFREKISFGVEVGPNFAVSGS